MSRGKAGIASATATNTGTRRPTNTATATGAHPTNTSTRPAEKKFSLVVSLLLVAVVISIAMIVMLILTIINDSFGYVYVQNTVSVEQLAVGVDTVAEIPRTQKLSLMDEYLSEGLMRRLEREKPLATRSDSEIDAIVTERIVDPRIVDTFSLLQSVTQRERIHRAATALITPTEVVFRSWLRPQIFSSPQSPVAERSGIRTALFGTVWVMFLAILFAFPIGVATAIYLEEYAPQNRLTNLIQLNIYNLAGIPSIIYGILGLVLFVRILEPLTSGALFGIGDGESANGRTILSAGGTLALLILPIIIINTQEAIKGVPNTIKYSSLGLGATRWQTIWHHILPYSIERIITGGILALSRAVGETAPLVVVGAATFITVNPSNVFAKFTVLPIQIYQWSQRPELAFRHIAAAAIIVLLVLLLSMNAIAIILRNRYAKQRLG